MVYFYVCFTAIKTKKIKDKRKKDQANDRC